MLGKTLTQNNVGLFMLRIYLLLLYFLSESLLRTVGYNSDSNFL